MSACMLGNRISTINRMPLFLFAHAYLNWVNVERQVQAILEHAPYVWYGGASLEQRQWWIVGKEGWG
jgi:hypothetical protein